MATNHKRRRHLTHQPTRPNVRETTNWQTPNSLGREAGPLNRLLAIASSQ